MKIAILCNSTIECDTFLNSQKLDSGSWIYSYLLKLSESENDNILIFCPKEGIPQNETASYTVDRFQILHFSFLNDCPGGADEQLVKIFWERISGFQPDVVHIFGTEYPHSFSMFLACRLCGAENRVVVNLQGFVGEIAKHYYDGLPEKVRYGKTFRDVLLKTNVQTQKHTYEKLAITETALLKEVQHAIGRTEWDHGVAKSIHPDILYHDCTELIRNEFFGRKWDVHNCIRHSIFMSQASYPVKGFHYMLQALALILSKFPDTVVYVAGSDIVNRPKYRDSRYIRYLREIMRKNKLIGHVRFVGTLGPENMASQYLSANVFVVCSQIENESNALSEAMLCGTPSVCAYVGGMRDRIKNGQNGLTYSAGNVEELADAIRSIFVDDVFAAALSEQAAVTAKQRFQNETNYLSVRAVYEEITSQRA